MCPTREEMQEIEISSRLYIEGNAQYMTASLICRAETDSPQTTPVTFILAGGRLVTLRYEDPRPFQTFPLQVERHGEATSSALDVLLGLLEAIVDRTADILERVQGEVDSVSTQIFSPTQGKAHSKESGTRYRAILQAEGRNQLLTLKARESLVSIGRVVTFLGRPTEFKPSKLEAARLKTLSRDLESLSDHATHLAQTITFLLEATLGILNIEQNEIIKIFSIAAVVFLPPTLIASIEGMNFRQHARAILDDRLSARPSRLSGFRLPALLVLQAARLALVAARLARQWGSSGHVMPGPAPSLISRSGVIFFQRGL